MLYIKFLAFLTSIFAAYTATAQPRESHDLLPENTFTPGMEGPAVDKKGNLYAVNYAREGTVGIVTPKGEHRIYATLPEGSTGNGIRFDPRGRMLAADYTGHNILKIGRGGKRIRILAHEPAMHQPNDLAVSPDGYIYASDPDWKNDTGQLWLVTPEGETVLLESGMGTTNGIEVSPDGKRLYVGESVQRRIWVYDIADDHRIAGKKLFATFPDFGLDGMRCDREGNLYVTRYGKGTVAVFSPEGKPDREYRLQGSKPSNLTFDLSYSRLYITMADRGNFETIRFR